MTTKEKVKEKMRQKLTNGGDIPEAVIDQLVERLIQQAAPGSVDAALQALGASLPDFQRGVGQFLADCFREAFAEIHSPRGTAPGGTGGTGATP